MTSGVFPTPVPPGRHFCRLLFLPAVIHAGRYSWWPLFLSLLIPLLCAAQEPRFVYPLPPTDSFVVQSGMTYPSSSGPLAFDLFRPAKTTNAHRLPVLIVFNGFGGSFMRTFTQSQSWAKAATAHGLAAITLETTPGHVAQDFDSLLAHLTRRASGLRVDPDQIAVIAWSGNAAAAIETVENPSREAIKAAAIYYGSGPFQQVRLDLPVLFVRSGLDQPETNHYLDLTISSGLTANAPWTVLNYSSGHHAFDVFDDNDYSRAVVEATFQFFHLALSPSYQSVLRAGIRLATAASAFSTGDYAKAVTLYRPLVDAHPDDVRLVLAYGNSLLGARRYREARSQFDRAKAIGNAGPRDLGVPAARASILDHDPDAAIAWLKTIPPQFLPSTLESDSDFASLRGRQDFAALFRRELKP
jgi:dienelactone hydrolase